MFESTCLCTCVHARVCSENSIIIHRRGNICVQGTQSLFVHENMLLSFTSYLRCTLEGAFVRACVRLFLYLPSKNSFVTDVEKIITQIPAVSPKMFPFVFVSVFTCCIGFSDSSEATCLTTCCLPPIRSFSTFFVGTVKNRSEQDFVLNVHIR